MRLSSFSGELGMSEFSTNDARKDDGGCESANSMLCLDAVSSATSFPEREVPEQSPIKEAIVITGWLCGSFSPTRSGQTRTGSSPPDALATTKGVNCTSPFTINGQSGPASIATRRHQGAARRDDAHNDILKLAPVDRPAAHLAVR